MALTREDCRGIWVPLVTPFRDEQIDLDTLARVVEWLLTHGVRGLLVLGSTGEAPHLSDDEGVEVVQQVVATSAGRVPVMVGAGRPSSHATLRMIERYASAGADATLVITPSYYRGRMRPDVLHEYYVGVASQSALPVFVYYIPQVTGLELDAAWLARVVQHDNVWGFKDSSVRGGPLAATLQRATTSAFVGGGARIVEALEAGAQAAILAVAHVLPEVCVRLMTAWNDGRHDEARELQVHATALTQAFEGWTVPGVRWGLRLRGLDVGPPRAPLPPAPAEVQERVRRVLEGAAALIDDTAP